MSKTTAKPKVVILAGGLGMRLKEETEYKPKPMVLIGPHPILWHIMKSYMYYGFNDFIICLGYKGEMIKEYFLNYETYNNDFTLNVGANCKIKTHKSSDHDKFSVTLADTGLDTMTGGRVVQIEKYIDSDQFMLTYGDGVADLNIKNLYDYHLSHGKIATVTGVHPESRFGELIVKEDKVVEFKEKQPLTRGFINGGFFVFNRGFFKYLDPKRDCFFEREPVKHLIKDDQLNVHRHEGFWQCMDTHKDVQYLNALWEKGAPSWKVWK
jgi:glucose-1-phosphate cytidylyltransferase